MYRAGPTTWIEWETLEHDADGKPIKHTVKFATTKVVVTAVTASTMTVQLAQRTPPARNYGPPKRKRW